MIDETGAVVGLATWGAVDESTHTNIAGFNFIVTSNVVKDYLRKAGAIAGQSETDIAYRAGLDHHFAGHWQPAIDSLEDVKRLFPAHPEVCSCSRRWTGSARRTGTRRPGRRHSTGRRTGHTCPRGPSTRRCAGARPTA